MINMKNIATFLLASTIAGDFAPKTALVCNALQLGDGEELLGSLGIGEPELINDLADVGALPMRFMRPAQGARGRGRVPAPIVRPGYALPARRLIPQVPGAPSIGLRLQPLGFPIQVFNATSGTALPATTRPQRPFKAKRLVVDLARTGATATGLISVTSINIGTNNQMVATQPIGAGSFAPGAYDTNMELAACTTALDVTVGYATSVAPGATDHIDIATTMFGEAVG